MTYQEAEIVLPIADMFDLLLLYVKATPLRKGNTMTKLDVENLVTSNKAAAMQSVVPKYDVFNYLLVYIRTKLLEGPSPCAFDPKFCLWIENRQSVLKSLAGAR